MMPILACLISFLLAAGLVNWLDNDELKERRAEHRRNFSQAAVVQSVQRSGQDASTARTPDEPDDLDCR